MFKLADGREAAYQWDIGVKLNLTGNGADSINEVHFYRPNDKEPLTVKVDKTGNEPTVEIPNILLQGKKSIIVYAFYRGEDKETTKLEEILRVKPRPKPAGYVYKETELLTYKALEEKVAELERKCIKNEEDIIQIRDNIDELKTALNSNIQEVASLIGGNA